MPDIAIGNNTTGADNINVQQRIASGIPTLNFLLSVLCNSWKEITMVKIKFNVHQETLIWEELICGDPNTY